MEKNKNYHSIYSFLKIKEYLKEISESVECNLIFVLLFITAVNIPYFTFETYSSPDEFTSLAVPAFFNGYDWSDITTLSSYHGFGFTILLTPLLGWVKTGEVAYHIVVGAALFLRLILAYFFFKILSREFKIKPMMASLATICYVCGPLGPDDTCSLSALSELPLAFCFLMALYFGILAQKNKSFKWSLGFGAVLGYCYTIHSRCIIIYLNQ